MKFQKMFVGAIALTSLMASSTFADPPKTLDAGNCKDDLARILSTKTGETVNLDHAVSDGILTLNFTRVGTDKVVQRSILQTSFSIVEADLKDAAKKTPYQVDTGMIAMGMGPVQIHGRRDDLDDAIRAIQGKKIKGKSANPLLSSELPLVLKEVAVAACESQVKVLALQKGLKTFGNGVKDAYNKVVAYFNPTPKPAMGQFQPVKLEKRLTAPKLTRAHLKWLREPRTQFYGEYMEMRKMPFTERELELLRMKAANTQ